MRTNSTWNRRWKRSVLTTGLVVLVLVFAACGSEPEATPTPEEPAAVEEPAAPEEPTEEPTATPETEEEATATPEPEEEPTATAEPEEEPTAAPEPEEEPSAALDAIANGQYLVNLTGGCGCHFNREEGALAGGNEFAGPFGVAYAPNITPDPETGIGNWSPEEIVDALRLGARPDGTQLVPVMPYRAFSALSDQEALNVAAYLLSLEPVANQVPARDLANEPEPFTPAVAPPAEPPTDPVARGEELVTIARCGDCHTPTNEDGTPNMDMYLAGAQIQDEFAANITPDEETGIGAWSEEEIASFLRTGMYAEGGQVEGAMATQIDRRFSQLTEEDALAIAAYLMSLEPISTGQ